MIWAALLGDGTGEESWKTALSTLLAMGCKEVGYSMPPILLAMMPFMHIMFANTRVRAADTVGSRSDVLVINAVMLANSGVGKVRTHLRRREIMSSFRLVLSRAPYIFLCALHLTFATPPPSSAPSPNLPADTAEKHGRALPARDPEHAPDGRACRELPPPRGAHENRCR
jgi:hypothetical protein